MKKEKCDVAVGSEFSLPPHQPLAAPNVVEGCFGNVNVEH